jgi:hypothetical protein
MTYRIEITAQTIQELAGKLITLGQQFQLTPRVDILNTVVNEVTSGEGDGVALNSAVVEEPETGTDAKVEPTVQPKPKPEKAKPAAKKAEEPKDEPAAALDYQKDIVPKVLTLIEKRGKDAAQDILTTFGVPKASGVKPAQYAELLAMISDAMDH